MSTIRLRLTSAASVAAVAGAMVGISAASHTPASVRPPDETRSAAGVPANSVNSASVINESLTGTDVKNGTLNQSDLNAAVVNLLRTPKANSVWSGTLNDNIVTEAKLASSVRNKLVATGAALSTKDWTEVRVINTPLDTTSLGSLTMPAGVWTISTAAVFRSNGYDLAGTRPGVVLRYNATTSNPWGQDAGMIRGVEISGRPGYELHSFTAKRVVFSKPTTISVLAFGERDDGGWDDRRFITAKAEVSWARG